MKLRFSIRDLLWLTLVVALVVGWWIDRSRMATRLNRVDAVVEIAKRVAAKRERLKKYPSDSPYRYAEADEIQFLIGQILHLDE